MIGVNSQIATNGADSNSGVGFAVPVDTVKFVVPQIKTGGKVERAYLGVATRRRRTARGARRRASSPAARPQDAGLQTGDKIVAIDGAHDHARPTRSRPAVSTRKPGETVKVTVERGGDRRTLTVKLGTRPETAQPAMTRLRPQETTT